LDSAHAPGIRRVASGAVTLAAIFLLSYGGVRPPSPKAANSPPGGFSSVRALGVLGRILPEGAPHPVGSPADDTVRTRIVDELTSLGYDPQVQNAFDCNEFGNCASVNNVLVRIEGSESAQAGNAVLLASHYDSVPAGPGASDDGTSVAAALEIARALKSLPKPRHAIILLIDEGEEAGLLGARAFMDWSPWAKQVRAVVNLDARGTSGPSLMFETGSANDWTVRLFRQAVAKPMTGSIFYTVYQMLPNNTDLTVFKALGKQGVNFAFMGDEPEYHTPLDSIANVDASTLQHQGDNALAMTLSFANADLASPPEGEAVFFDVFGRHVFQWPQKRALPLGTAVALLLALEIAWLFRRRWMQWREFLAGLGAWLMALVTTGALALILRAVLRLMGALPVDWIAHPLAVRIAFWSLALAVIVVHGIAFARRAGFWGSWTGVWMWWVLLGVIVGWISPGMSYVIQVPAGAAVLAALPAAARQKESAGAQWFAAVAPLAAAAIVGFAPLILIYPALGNRVLVALAVLVALVLTPLLPLCVDLSGAEGLMAVSMPGVPVLVAGLAAFVAAIVPAYSAQAPEHVNLQLWQDGDSGKAQWVVEPASARLPEPIRLAAAFHAARTGEVPWGRGAGFLADAPAMQYGAPTFTVQDSAMAGVKRSFVALLRSERGAPSATVMFPADSGVEEMRVENVPVQAESPHLRAYFNGWFVYSCPAMPVKGVELSFLVPAGRAITVMVLDRSYGLPDDGKFLVNARPLTAAPSGAGDTTVISRRVELNP
jgi:hypothetical protein